MTLEFKRPKVINIGQNQSSAVFDRQDYTAGTLVQDISVYSNAILSSVFVESITESLTVRWYDTSTSRAGGERNLLLTQGPFTAPMTESDKEFALRINNHCQCEIELTGTAKFSVFAQATTFIPIEVQGVKDGQSVSANDTGQPLACLDPATGLYRIVRCTDFYPLPKSGGRTQEITIPDNDSWNALPATAGRRHVNYQNTGLRDVRIAVRKTPTYPLPNAWIGRVIKGDSTGNLLGGSAHYDTPASIQHFARVKNGDGSTTIAVEELFE